MGEHTAKHGQNGHPGNQCKKHFLFRKKISTKKYQDEKGSIYLCTRQRNRGEAGGDNAAILITIIRGSRKKTPP